MIHYHGTPITPRSVLLSLAGRHFCVSYWRPDDLQCCFQIGQSVMLDNGAFSAWKSGAQVDFDGYYEWADENLSHPTAWAVIPDLIEGSVEDNDMLVARCPLPYRNSAPVWHLHEPFSRLGRFLDEGYWRICFGSSAEYATVGSDAWHRRVSAAFNWLSSRGKIPWIHMLRGMSLSGSHYPFSSVDSTDIARNHARNGNARAMADRWDSLQCPARWVNQLEQENLL